jgi:hypothetical protein
LNKYYSVYDFVNKRVGFAEAAEDSKTICEQDSPLDLDYDAEAIPTLETIERTPDHGSVPAPAPAPPASAPKPYVPYDANSSSSSSSLISEGLQATEKFGIACAFMGVCLLGLMFFTRRNRRETRFQEIQMASIDDADLRLS